MNDDLLTPQQVADLKARAAEHVALVRNTLERAWNETKDVELSAALDALREAEDWLRRETEADVVVEGISE